MGESAGSTSGSNRWLKSSEAARYLGFSSRTLKRLVTAGEIPAYRWGPRGDHYFRVSDLDAALARHLVPASGA